MIQRRAGPQRRRTSSGFSLIELMIALVAGLVVVGAVLAFTVSSVSANADFVKSTRLMQELRNSSNHITAELKRAGYDENAMKYVANPSSTEVSKFSPMLINVATAGSHCVVYAYDRSPGVPGEVNLDNGEIRAVRRSTVDGIGVLEVAESATSLQPVCNGDGPDYSTYPPVCNATTGWCPLSDPRVLHVSAFTVGIGATGDSYGVRKIDGGSGFNAMQLRELEITITGNLLNDTAISRSVKANIKVRADCLRPSVDPACNVAPAP